MTVPGLSVCCLTADPPAQVAAILASLRPVADEVVVAVDSRVDPDRLGPIVAVADVVVRFEYVDPPELARPWLVGQCQGDTILMIDGDEVPSTALLEVLPTLAADRGTTQFRLARRWCFPDEGHWLAERPWWPDYQRRLVRPGPDLDFDRQVHGGVRPALPARYVDEPLYHLACLTTPFADRRARVRRYESARPGLEAVGGGPMNDTLYVPEHFATLRPELTPAEDLERLTAVLEASHGPAPEATTSIPVVSAAEVAAAGPIDPLAGQGYRATVAVVELDRRTAPGNDTYVVVEVRNEGGEVIPHLDAPGVQVRLAARLLDPASGDAILPWALTPLPGAVPPGEARRAEALVRIPSRAGAYLLEVDLVNERSRWFGCPARADLLVATRWGRYAP